MTLPMIGNQALLVHLFMAVAGDHPVRDHAYLRQVWQACGEGGLGLDSPVAITGLPVAPTEWDPAKWPSGAMVAVRARRGRGVQQAVLRREHDMVCLTVMREPGDGSTWADLAREWSSTMAAPPPGLIGVARIFTARLTDPGVAPSPGSELSDAVRAAWPEQFRAEEWPQGVRTPEGFAVWEVPAQPDDRVERQIAVIAAGADDARLSAWAWIRGDRTLPPFTRYLMHAAKLRYELRVWADGQSLRELRLEANETVGELLELTQSQPEDAELLAAAERLTSLQARHLGLVLTSSRLRKMRRTVQIAVSNMAQLPAAEPNQGLFDDDRELGTWFAQQLDDNAVYLDADQERASVVGRHFDQLMQRSRQRRQERLNLGLTAVIGTIASSLTTIQLLSYTLPLPAHLKPGLVVSLGALSLYVFLLVLRRTLPQPMWPRLLAHGGFALLVSALVWVGVLAARGPAVGIGWIWACLGAGSVAGLGLALVSKLRRRRARHQEVKSA